MNLKDLDYHIAKLFIHITSRITETEDGHWLWWGSFNDVDNPTIGVSLHSLGISRKGTKTYSVRRVVFAAAKRPLVDAELVYLACEEPRCVAPDHLTALTHREFLNVEVKSSRYSTNTPITLEESVE